MPVRAGDRAQGMTLRRKLLIGGTALVLLVALYAAAGYWIAPGYVREALAEAASARGLALELGRVETRPFALRVELGGIALRGPQGRVFAEAESAAANLAWASLWRRGWIVQELRVVAPQLALGRLPPMEGDKSAAAGEAPAVTIGKLIVENGRVRHAASDFALEAVTLRARDLSTLNAAAGSYEAGARLADGAGEIASLGKVSLAPLTAEGTLSVAALRAGQLLGEAAGRLQGTAKYVYGGNELHLQDVSLRGDGLAYAGLELPEATLRAEKVPIVPRAPFQAALRAEVAPQGKIAAQGSVSVDPLELQLQVDAEALPLARAQRWLPEQMALRIASGALSGKGLLDIEQEQLRYEGSASVHDLRLEEADSGALLLAWQRAGTDKLRLHGSPVRIEAGEIVAEAPEGRLVIEGDGSLNFAQVFPGRAGREKSRPVHAVVERLRIEKGTLHFADRSLETPFEATLVELSGTLGGFSTVPGEPARLRLDGRVQPYGVARIRGTLDVNAPTARADVTATFRNLRLEAFNPYVVKFAGYRIESGRLSARLRYEVRDARLAGRNDLQFENMRLGEKVEQKGLLDLPLELAVALLADAKGRIDLDIPVRGNLGDPHFDMGAIVARAVGNAVKKIVSAPFRALAALFDGKDRDPGTVAFAPGTASLSPPAEEKLAQLAAALEERPRLGVVVHGGYDAQRDREALRLRAAREDVARAAGVERPLDLSDPKLVRAAEALYVKRVGERAGLEALRKSAAGYGRLLLQRLAASTPLDEGAAQGLARSRAESVRGALLEQGIDAARVGLGEAVQKQAAGEGVPTELALSAAHPGLPAEEGKHLQAEQEAGPVAAAQRALNAGGFDAGPVDGILGPRTKRALIHFQAVTGLELTGKLDAATRARLLAGA